MKTVTIFVTKIIMSVRCIFARIVEARVGNYVKRLPVLFFAIMVHNVWHVWLWGDFVVIIT